MATTKFNQNVYVNGNLSIEDDMIVEANATVNGNSQLTGNLTVQGTIIDPDIDLSNELSEDLANNDYFLLKNVSSNESVKITYSNLQNDIFRSLRKSTKIYVDGSIATSGNGSYAKPYQTLEEAFAEIQGTTTPISISVLPGTHYTNGELSLPDNCSVVSTNGQYATEIIMNPGYEEKNCFLVGSGCYIQGLTFRNQRVDDFDNPTAGFAVAFRPGARIIRSPYVRDCSQVSNYTQQAVAAPLDPLNANPLVGKGGGMLLADRSVLNQNSIFPYMLAFGATPRSPNGLGYVAKNGAGINGIGSITIFQRCAFYALNGGQVTLNNSGTQFGDISMRANGSTPVAQPYEIADNLLVSNPSLGNSIIADKDTIVNAMWDYLVAQGYTVDETFTRRDAGYFLQSVGFDIIAGTQTGVRNFVAGFFDYKADLLFDPDENAGSGTLKQSFYDSFDFMKNYIVTQYSATASEETMITALIDDIIKQTIDNTVKIIFGSLIESIGHQFNLAGAGVNKNALPLNFRRVGTPLPATGSVLQQNSGRVRWSGADELNNQYFAKGLRINGRTGRLEGRPFTSSVRRLARRAANSRTF